MPIITPYLHLAKLLTKLSEKKKLLAAIIDNKSDFAEQLNTVCIKENLRLHALNRICRFLSPK